MTFVKLAAKSGTDAARRDRNRAYARAAYDALVTFAPRVEMSSHETREIHGLIESLRVAIDAIP